MEPTKLVWRHKKKGTSRSITSNSKWNIPLLVHPNAQGLVLFDNASSHKKLPDDALNVDKMNVHSEGMQPAMRSSTWEGHTQTMVCPDSKPKGRKAFLEERGVNTKGMKALDMREKLRSYIIYTLPKSQNIFGGFSLKPRALVCVLPEVPQ